MYPPSQSLLQAANEAAEATRHLIPTRGAYLIAVETFWSLGLLSLSEEQEQVTTAIDELSQ